MPFPNTEVDVEDLPPLETAPDKPPRERQRTRRKVSAQQKVIDGLTSLYVVIGSGVMLVNQYDGQLIFMKAHDMAVALETVASRNKAFYAVLLRLSSASDVTAILMSYGAVAYGIAANHGQVPVGVPHQLLNIPLPPERAIPPETGQEAAAAYDAYMANLQAEQAQQDIYTPGEETGPLDNGVAEALAGEQVPGTHINADIMARLREQAYAQQAVEAKLAASRGADGVPLVNPGAAFGLGGTGG